MHNNSVIISCLFNRSQYLQISTHETILSIELVITKSLNILYSTLSPAGSRDTRQIQTANRLSPRNKIDKLFKGQVTFCWFCVLSARLMEIIIRCRLNGLESSFTLRLDLWNYEFLGCKWYCWLEIESFQWKCFISNLYWRQKSFFSIFNKF